MTSLATRLAGMSPPCSTVWRTWPSASRSTALPALAGEFATGGGINEQVVAHLKNTGALAAVSDALNAVLQRMKTAP
jgi:hypothetical protein